MKSVESWVLSYLLNSLWQIPLLLAAGWLAGRIVRPLGAAAEHRVWVGVLILQATLPAISSLPLAWLREMWSLVGAGAGRGAGHVAVEAGPGFTMTDRHIDAWLLGFAAMVYGAVTAYFVARFAWRCVHLAAIRRNAMELDLGNEIAAIWARCVRRLGRQVKLAESTRISAPVTMGIGRPLVLLPESMTRGLAEAEFRTVIEHEFAHIARNDFAKNLAYELLALPMSYHPLLRITRDRIMETREMVCDEAAAKTSGPMEYGRSLLRLAALLVPARTSHAIGIFDAKTLERRLMRLKNRQGEIRGGRRMAALFACAVLAAATCGSAVALHLNVNAGVAATTKSNRAPLNVPAGEMQGNILSKVMPKYPPEAKKAGIQGKVELNAVISKRGNIENLKVASGPKELQQSALDAVRQWKYKPYLLNGNPVEVKTTINVIYSLEQ